MHQGAFLGANLTVRRNLSVARPRPIERNRPQWNSQVKRKKVTTTCLWNACKALTIGLLLMLIGCAMATIGYYAETLSVAQEIRGNTTVKVKNESRGFHLNNLSYAGPIIMGVGGFIVVASCVMTFEARDSAAKVVPARLKAKSSPHQSSRQESVSGKISMSSQTKWDNLGVFRAGGGGGDASSGGSASPGLTDAGRRALTAAFIQFSCDIQASVDSTRSPVPTRKVLPKCPSAPNLAALSPSERIRRPVPRPSPQPSTQPLFSAQYLLPCPFLQRQAVSMDNPAIRPHECTSPIFRRPRKDRSEERDGDVESLELGASASVIHKTDSETSMALDLHIPNCPVTLRVHDESRSPSRRGDGLAGLERGWSGGSSRGSRPCSPSSRTTTSGIRVYNAQEVDASTQVLCVTQIDIRPRTPRRFQSTRSETAKRHLFVRQRPVEASDYDPVGELTAESIEHRTEIRITLTPETSMTDREVHE